MSGQHLVIDGFNVVTTVEAALGGGVVLACRDETFRDLAGVHGTYRKVAETLPALERIGARLGELAVTRVHWLFDRPVSNSGQIRGDPARNRGNSGMGLDRRAGGQPRLCAQGIRGHCCHGRQRRSGPVRPMVQPGANVIEAACPGATIVDLNS